MSNWIIWVIAGLVPLMLEIHAPGAFMMWLGLAACGTGLIVLLTGIGFELQVVTIAVLAAISRAVGLRFRYRRPPRMEHAQQSGLAGRAATTALSFQGREGRAHEWATATGQPGCRPIPERTRLTAAGGGRDGTVLIVRPSDEPMTDTVIWMRRSVSCRRWRTRSAPPI
jgi:membrane protein implicated in regulation of membrane protease activity